MQMHEHIEELAEKSAGNWQKFESFGWSNQPEDADKWAIFNLSHRDSDVVSRSNARVISKALEPFVDDVSEERHGHWAVGHVNATCIRVYDADGNITPAFAALAEIMIGLEEYPVASDDDLSELECDDENESWRAYGERELRRCLRDSDCIDRSNLVDAIPSDVLRSAWDAIADAKLGGERCIHSNEGCGFTFDAIFGDRAGYRRFAWSDARPYLIAAIHSHREFVAREAQS